MSLWAFALFVMATIVAYLGVFGLGSLASVTVQTLFLMLLVLLATRTFVDLPSREAPL